MIVRESIEFKRGEDPKSSLNIGRGRKLTTYEELESAEPGYYIAHDIQDVPFPYQLIEIGDGRGIYPRSYLSHRPYGKFRSDDLAVSMSRQHIFKKYDWIKKVEAEQHFKWGGGPDDHYMVKESIEFKRGGILNPL